jgi:hypothetical protein
MMCSLAQFQPIKDTAVALGLTVLLILAITLCGLAVTAATRYGN